VEIECHEPFDGHLLLHGRGLFITTATSSNASARTETKLLTIIWLDWQSSPANKLWQGALFNDELHALFQDSRVLAMVNLTPDNWTKNLVVTS
jgi:hypothetical protein